MNMSKRLNSARNHSKMPKSNGAYRNSNTILLQVKMAIILIILKPSNILLYALMCYQQNASRVIEIIYT
jgi:hypothetical protein